MIGIYVFVGLLANSLLGAVVWTLIDDSDRSYYRWFVSCPPRIAWFAQPLVLTAWPVGLWFHWRRMR